MLLSFYILYTRPSYSTDFTKINKYYAVNKIIHVLIKKRKNFIFFYVPFYDFKFILFRDRACLGKQFPCAMEFAHLALRGARNICARSIYTKTDTLWTKELYDIPMGTADWRGNISRILLMFIYIVYKTAELHVPWYKKNKQTFRCIA